MEIVGNTIYVANNTKIVNTTISRDSIPAYTVVDDLD